MPLPDPERTISERYQRDWPRYFDAVTDQPPRDTLLRALAAFDADDAQHPTRPRPLRLALDLGCGEGRDTRAIIRHGSQVAFNHPDRSKWGRPTGWIVVAIDSSDEGLSRVSRGLLMTELVRIHRVRLSLEELADTPIERLTGPLLEALAGHGAPPQWLPAPHDVSLINASFALPFCEPSCFPALWRWIANTLSSQAHPTARFSGQLFGDRDDWAAIRPGSHHSREQIETLLTRANLTPEYLDEIEKDGSDAMGGTKHHHIFHIVARRED